MTEKKKLTPCIYNIIFSLLFDIFTYTYKSHFRYGESRVIYSLSEKYSSQRDVNLYRVCQLEILRIT